MGRWLSLPSHKPTMGLGYGSCYSYIHSSDFGGYDFLFKDISMVYICVHVCTCVRMCVFVCVCVLVCTCVYVCVCARVCVSCVCCT